MDIINKNEDDPDPNNLSRCVFYKGCFLKVDIIYDPDEYHKLIFELSLHITDEQLLEIGEIDIDEQELVIYDDQIIESFKFVKEGKQYDSECSQCVCGKLITKEYFVQNKKTDKLVIVGSKCVERFYYKEFQVYVAEKNESNHSIKKKKRSKYFCVECKEQEVEGYSVLCDDCE